MSTIEDPRRPSRRLRRRLWLARLALTWESLWPAAWPVIGIVGLFLGVALLDVLPLLPPWLHALILAAFVTAFGVALWRGLSRFELADEVQARRRIERDSGLAHRPLGVLEDNLAGSPRDAVARALWAEHRRRMAAAIARLRIAPPSPGMAAKDPWGLRAAVLLLLVVAVAGARWDAPTRIARALTPPVSALAAENIVAQLWLTPPQHTGLPPIFLDWPATQQQPETLRVPAGTAVLALLHGTEDSGALRIGGQSAEFKRLGDGSQRVEAKIDSGDSLAVAAGGRPLARWPLAVLQDAVPSIAFTRAPRGDEAGRLRLDYEMSDDYGVAKAWATVRRLDQPQAEPLVLELPLAGPRRNQAKLGSRHDLTPHPWAGLPVSITPTAQDALGQTGSGEALNTVLPEREFTHPVARAIIAERRKLTPDGALSGQVIAGLDTISARPDAFNQDLVVFLALRSARARLYHAPTPDNIATARDMLWNTALRLEEGDKGVAERALAEAAERLEKALAEGAPQDEIDRLMNELQQAMQQYLQALAEQAQREGRQAQPLDPNAETITPQELGQMMERMREMARLGSRDAAQQMLSELRNMLENLRAGMAGGRPDPAMQQAQQAISELGKIAKRQRELMDQSFRQAQEMQQAMRGQQGEPGQQQDMQGQQGMQGMQGQQGMQGMQGQQGRQGMQGQQGRQQGRQGQQGQQGPAGGAQAQEALRRQLGELMRQLGESMGDIPPGLGGAEQSMRDATGQLQQGQPGGAAEAQGQALQQLQEGAQAAMQALSQQMQQGDQGWAGMQNGGGMRRDPLGRRMPNPLGDDGSVHVPDEAELHRAREVLDELRRRAGQPQRPPQERDYLHRLLRQF